MKRLLFLTFSLISAACAASALPKARQKVQKKALVQWMQTDPKKVDAWLATQAAAVKANCDLEIAPTVVARDIAELFLMLSARAYERQERVDYTKEDAANRTISERLCVKAYGALNATGISISALANAHKVLAAYPIALGQEFEKIRSNDRPHAIAITSLGHRLEQSIEEAVGPSLDNINALSKIVVSYVNPTAYSIGDLIEYISVDDTLKFNNICSTTGLSSIPGIRFDQMMRIRVGVRSREELSPVKIINLSGCLLETIDYDAFIQTRDENKWRPACPEVMRLYLANNQLREVGVDWLVMALPKLCWLDLSGNPLTNPEQIKAAWVAAKKHPSCLTL